MNLSRLSRPLNNNFNIIHQQIHSFVRETFPNKLTHYLRRAQLIDSIRLYLCSNSLPPLLKTRLIDSFVVTHAIQSAPNEDSALLLVESLKKFPRFFHDQSTLHSLATALAKNGRVSELKSLIGEINAGKFDSVPVFFMNLMQWYAACKDVGSALDTWFEYRKSVERNVCTESYNIVIDEFVDLKGENLKVEEDDSSDFDKDEIDCPIAISLSIGDLKRKKVIEEEDDDSSLLDDYDELARAEEEERLTREEEAKRLAREEEVKRLAREAKAKRLAEVEEDERRARAEEDEKRLTAQLEEDEQLVRPIQQSMSVESPLRYGFGSGFSPYPFHFPSGYMICARCQVEISHGRFLSCMGAVWDPECFRCNEPIADIEFSISGNRPYHKSCYKKSHHPRCDLCDHYILTNSACLIEYKAHPFWLQKYCPSHERDGTPRCCSCEGMETKDARYLSLDDGRKLSLECLDSAIMDTHECQPLYFEIREFYEGLNMKMEQEIPMLLVERQALNEAMEGERRKPSI